MQIYKKHSTKEALPDQGEVLLYQENDNLDCVLALETFTFFVEY